jgi:SAM-dependent methyltransferase
MSTSTPEAKSEVKKDVRQFYDQVGWSLVGEDRLGTILYQNARYEDLRPVSREYIHRAHLRVCRHISPHGRFLLDAGSGPIQYPEYLEYSRGYQFRVCADISITALIEARKRLSALVDILPEHGLYVVADVANLPFKSGVFDGAVSLHTIHHLPEDEHLQAYRELYRLLALEKNAVVVNGWPSSKLMAFFDPLVRFSNRLRYLVNRLRGRTHPLKKDSAKTGPTGKPEECGRVLPGGRALPGGRELPTGETSGAQKGTFTSRHDVAWIKEVVGAQMPVEILVWRSASVRFLRAVIFPWLGGRYWLRLLYRLEERNPHYFGENGQYPLIVVKKGISDS